MYLTLDKVKLKNCRVLVRPDFNCPVNEKTKKIEDYNRIKEHTKTIKELIRKKAKIVIIAHQGRKNDKDFTNLKQHSLILSKLIKQKVKFVNDVIGKKALKEINSLKNGEVLLLDNVRALKEENLKSDKPENSKIVKILSPLFDYFVFDALSVAHRNAPSVTGFGKTMQIIVGKVLEEELKNLKRIEKPKKPYIFILGGAKSDDCFNLIKKRIDKVDFVLCSGRIAELFLIAKGYNLGKRQKELGRLEEYKLIKDLKKFVNNKKILLPLDYGIKIKNKRKEIFINELPTDYEILDIGKKTINEYKKIIKKARTIYFKGPPGFYDKKYFDLGTKEVLRAIAKSKGFSIVGGGHTLDAVDRFIKRNKIDYISLSGGALLSFIAGEKLPGLEMLKKRKNE